ncbi:FAD-dependent oxidoreductase [Treponema parvum]|uniref:FAD-dependent oxidoreductase n=1 Tax=Treponema parvum TaxID=138851 RepID=A0A975F2V1_9SPIR|nr:NAD(P)/FAD-dependent oxidoreductase [Treponema parvum]QTQ13356.1 FAD-dependent oxidoreductase [Treponema parvum]
MKYSHIFQPGKIGNLILKNRIIMSPIGTRLTDVNGGVTEDMRAFYSERAKGGAAAVIIEATGISYPEAVGKPNHLRLCNDSLMPGHALLAESIHENGSLAISMLWHAGINKGILEGVHPVGPSAILNINTGLTPRELEKADIVRIQEEFAAAALRAKICGYDAIELHGGHGYLISSFVSKLTNHRNDEYGGSFENRIRFTLETVKKIKEKVGDNYPIMIRINGSDFFEGGITLEESIAFSKALEKTGIAAIDVSAGVYGSVDTMIEPISYEEGWKINLAWEIKKCVNIPVLGVGVLRSPEVVENILAEEKADFACLGRELMCEPHWVNKVRAGDKHILKCISCNACFAHTGKNLPIRCSLNPYAGRERLPIIHIAADKAKKIAVVGAGPSGITAALIADMRGHSVTLFEKSDRIGGQLYLAQFPPGKSKITDYIEYLTEELKRSSVKCVFKHEFKPEESSDFDEVIIATGAACRVIDIPGATLGANAILSWDALIKGHDFYDGKRIVILGGGFVGCETALYCKVSGARDVCIVEMLPALGGDVDGITRLKMLKELKDEGVAEFLSNSVCEVRNEKAVLKDGRQIGCDVLVIAVGSKPDTELRNALLAEGKFSYGIGDCSNPGRMLEAVSSGFEAAYSI